jgi:16S rRNA (uracil1498-N3)-methyltransferase
VGRGEGREGARALVRHRAGGGEAGPPRLDPRGLVAASRTLVLEPTGAARLTGLTLVGEERDVLLVVGPEGGIASDELDRLAAAGASIVRLGESVLRTSTAGPAALAVVSAALGRW